MTENIKNMPHMVSVMTPFPHSIESDRSLSEAKAMMHVSEIRHLPVVEQGRVVGLLSDRDIKLTLSVCKDESAAEEITVGQACSLDVYVVDVDERLDAVVMEMAERKIGSALVTRKGKLVGIFTTTDACLKLAELLKLHHPDA